MGCMVGFWEILSQNQVFTTSEDKQIAHALLFEHTLIWRHTHFFIVLHTNRQVLMCQSQWWHSFTLILKSRFLVEQKPLKKGVRRLIFTNSQKIQFLLLNDNNYTICRETHVVLISVLKNIKNDYRLYSKVINTKVYPWRLLSKNLFFLILGWLSSITASGKN